MATAEAVDAATVLLCRDSPAGVEVHLQRRGSGLGFAGGLWAFPGGRVDRADHDPAVDAHWTGPPPTAWARRLTVPPGAARALVVAACRETFEEAGVLLSTRQPAAAEAADARRALLHGDATFAEVLATLDADLDSTGLRFWAWWVTPEAEPRRYDTRFFLARMPAGAATDAHADEAVDEMWASAPVDGLMLPPTRHTLLDVVAHPTVAAAMDAAATRQVTRVLPVIDGDEVVLPWGARQRLPRP